MKKALLIWLLAMCCLALTACYTDSDPWPAADGLGGSQATTPPVATAVPATEEPLPEDAVDVSPNFNG